MGAIVPFVPRAAAIDSPRPPGVGAAAIIIFPGVRYERRTADAVVPKANVPKRKKTGPARR